MQTNNFEQVQANTGLSAQDLEKFLITYVVEAAGRYSQEGTEKYLFWNFGPEGKLSRRLLVNFEKDNYPVKVSFEVAYELFEGDVHYYVEQVGAVRQGEINIHLAALVQVACQKLQDWQPTSANIWN